MKLEIEIKRYNRKLNETTGDFMRLKFQQKKTSLKIWKYSIRIFFNGNWKSSIILKTRRDFKKIQKCERLKEIT